MFRYKHHVVELIKLFNHKNFNGTQRLHSLLMFKYKINYIDLKEQIVLIVEKLTLVAT